MDKSWVNMHPCSKGFEDGVKAFVQHAFLYGFKVGGKVKCPCTVCLNLKYVDRKTLNDHLMCNKGIMKNYTLWHLHGETLASVATVETTSINGVGGGNDVASSDNCMEDDVIGMLHDGFGVPIATEDTVGGMTGEINGVPNNVAGETSGIPNIGVAGQFYKLVEESKEPLYPGCKNYTKLSFLFKLWHLKCLGGMSNTIFSSLLDLLRKAFPEGCTLPENFTQSKKIILDMGLGYNKIDACPNDCMLFWKENSKLENCTVCRASRYAKESGITKNKTSAKILRHFPLKPRLQRLFMSSKVASDMRWHEEGRVKDGKMRHIADSKAWEHFNEMNTSFATESRNVRLGLASDGFNPFGNMSSTHSTWPVILIPYNLPPWLCMKQPHMILSLLISGPKSPGNDIDVYMRPLIDELKELWKEGLDTYDASRKEMFKMHAAVLCTISDFPGMAMLSGWSTKGYLACPSCHRHTCSEYLSNGRKICYMGHRRFLPLNHKFRRLKKDFNGDTEMGVAPNSLTGTEIFEQLEGIPNRFGKVLEGNDNISGRKRPREEERPGNWKKLTIFCELPYYPHLLLKHNFDVMHVEKNLCDNVVGTILDLDNKSKDGLKARLDLQQMGVRPELHPQWSDERNKYYLPPACYSMDKTEKQNFCKVLKSIKVPDGYSSNFSNCIKVKEGKISGLKSHDSHVILQQFLPLAIRKSLPKKVSSILIELSAFFRELCTKVGQPEDFRRLGERIALVLCNLERIFPPAFFDIMVHIPIHLAFEAEIGGPVHYRWMYPVERYLCTLKKYVRNRAQPEGSIAEGYVIEECLTFVTRYLSDVETRLTRPNRYKEDSHIGGVVGFMLSHKEMEQLHEYVLSNADNISKYIKQHHNSLEMLNPRLSKREIQKKHKKEFAGYFRTCIRTLIQAKKSVPKDFDIIAEGPFSTAKKFTGYTVGGFHFKTLDRDHGSKTQNSGVSVIATVKSYSSSKDRRPIESEVTYYGRLIDIIEVSYPQGRTFLLFKCDWVDVTSSRGIQVDELGFTLVNFSHLFPTQKDEPYVLASQVKQVFYVQDPVEPDWHVVVKTKPRDTYDMGEDDDISFDNDLYGNGNQMDDGEDDDINLVRGCRWRICGW